MSRPKIKARKMIRPRSRAAWSICLRHPIGDNYAWKSLGFEPILLRHSFLSNSICSIRFLLHFSSLMSWDLWESVDNISGVSKNFKSKKANWGWARKVWSLLRLNWYKVVFIKSLIFNHLFLLGILGDTLWVIRESK